MKVVELHPEDLLDKELTGDLTAPERARLDAHLERCTTCRFERDVRADFRDELAGEPSSQRIIALLEQVPLPTRVDSPPDRPGSGMGRSRRMVALLVAAALLVGGLATAAGVQVWTARAPAGKDRAEEHIATLPAPSPRSDATVAAIPARLEVQPEAVAEEPSIVLASAHAVDTAAMLFESAGEARRKGDYARAITLHQKLQSAHPASREAHASQATMGRLLLDRGDPAAALASFDAYRLRGPGALDESVLVGRATALDRLGRNDEARAAWSLLLDTFPDTPYAEHARLKVAAPPP